MTETRMPAAIDAIVSRLKTAGLTVWDGPILTGDYSNAVYVGFDGDYNDGEERASTTFQEWHGLGAKARRETIDVACAIVALTGNADTTWKPCRDTAVAMLETVGQTLRADPSLGLGPPTVSGDFVAELEPGDFFQEAGPGGMQARIVFTVHIKTRV